MTFPEWSWIIGTLLSLVVAMGPWMIKVHAKLEVIASKIVDLCDKMDRVSDEYRALWEDCSRHESRLDTHDVQLSHIAERLRKD